jgi:hypothetical protein
VEGDARALSDSAATRFVQPAPPAAQASTAVAVDVGQTRRVRWWRALSTPRGVFWSRVVAAALMVVLAVLVFTSGDGDQQIIGAGAGLVALINAGMAIRQWPALRAARGSTDSEPHG